VPSSSLKPPMPERTCSGARCAYGYNDQEEGEGDT
jgi:hypothetical protein